MSRDVVEGRSEKNAICLLVDLGVTRRLHCCRLATVTTGTTALFGASSSSSAAAAISRAGATRSQPPSPQPHPPHTTPPARQLSSLACESTVITHTATHTSSIIITQSRLYSIQNRSSKTNHQLHSVCAPAAHHHHHHSDDATKDQRLHM